MCSLKIGNVVRLPEVLYKCSKALFDSGIKSEVRNNRNLKVGSETIESGSLSGCKRGKSVINGGSRDEFH